MKSLEKLTQDREKIASTLERPSMRGIKNSVVERYSDKAHFIYELLQNANDAKATESYFILNENGLVFKHNGKNHFTVTDPDAEDQDKKNNKLGHINSITSIANSSKSVLGSSIGKFGIGFKAVFQYTETPHIYDKNFKFKIERFIIPRSLEEDFPGRLSDETVFYFPFDKSDVPSERAYADILDKLQKLDYPTLFLTELKVIKWNSITSSGEYRIKQIEENTYDDILYKYLETSKKIDSTELKEWIYIFTRKYNNLYTCSIGYFSSKNRDLIAKKMPAFCYFLTKDITQLNFILNAPFLLNDSRETIHRNKQHNDDMIKLLSELAADSLPILKNRKLLKDNIFNIIPYKDIEYGNEGFFNKFYEVISERFKISDILPSKDDQYAFKINAYWADVPELTNLFTNSQLSFLVNDPKAKWVFTSIGRTKDRDITEYIDGGSERLWERKKPNLIKSSLDFEYKIADLITPEFIKNQSIEWLQKFYAYLSERKSYQEKFKTKPIFKDINGNAVPAFEKKNGVLHCILFLPFDYDDSEYVFIHPDLLKNHKSLQFITDFGIKKPSLKDEIYNRIIPSFDNNKEVDNKNIILKLIKFWNSEGRPEEFINLLKDKSFLLYVSNNINEVIKPREKPGNIYFPTNELINYFKYKPSTKFIDIDYYHSFLSDNKNRAIFKDFIIRLGVNNLPRIIEYEISDFRRKQELNLPQSTNGYYDRNISIDYLIDGSEELLKNIDINKSILLWSMLRKLKTHDYSKGLHQYFYRTQHFISFESSILSRLKRSKWLMSTNNQFYAPHEIQLKDLLKEYESNPELESMLEFKPVKILTETERIASKFKNEEEAERARKLLEEQEKKEKNKKQNNFENPSKINTKPDYRSDTLSKTIEAIKDLKKELELENDRNHIKKSISEKNNNYDQDDDYSKGLDKLTKQIEKKQLRAELNDLLKSGTKYSLSWFRNYLELLTSYSQQQDNFKQKTISFQKIQGVPEYKNFFILTGASSYLSLDIESSSDFIISIFSGKGKKGNYKIESVSVKSQNLLIYCLDINLIDQIHDFNQIYKIEIIFTPVIDLLDRLKKSFNNNKYIKTWDNINLSLPPISYIYGPPGTGKTTYLCNFIAKKYDDKQNIKILFLTPTNKASDVFITKIYKLNSEISCARLGLPTDPELENLGFYRQSLQFDEIENLNVIASTIHRSTYFEISSYGLLFDFQWNYVLFDESSMISLPYITFALMAISKINPDCKFIVAGDPKQIPPVIDIDNSEYDSLDIQDENIYKMMNVDSFSPENQNIRNCDTISNLDIQYRSIKDIGLVFSELSYSKLLKHDRDNINVNTKQLPDNISEIITNNITFIDLPINPENSLFRINKLYYSSYHCYSAILVAEIIRYFDFSNNDLDWSIGIISPYKAQSLIINKIISSLKMNNKIKVISDTVHGFQGDECDIIFFVCNPNNYTYTNHEKSLLSKEYIYNVAISRARDYLVVLHPFTEIKNNVSSTN